MRSAAGILAEVFALLFLFGCVTNKTDSRIHYVDASLRHSIEITQTSLRVGEGGFLELQLDGRNGGNRDVRMDYLIEWLDDDGFVIKSVSSRWTPLFVGRNTGFNIHQVAPGGKACDFRIQFRRSVD